MNETIYTNTIFSHIIVNKSYNSAKEKMKTENDGFVFRGGNIQAWNQEALELI
jgi:hypothetical protein